MTIRIGASGWVYSHWRGVFYPNELRRFLRVRGIRRT